MCRILCPNAVKIFQILLFRHGNHDNTSRFIFESISQNNPDKYVENCTRSVIIDKNLVQIILKKVEKYR